MCWPDQQGRLRALRRERQSAAMTMTGGARWRHRRMRGRLCADMGGRLFDGAVKSPPPRRPAAASASMEDLQEQRQKLETKLNALHRRAKVLGSSPPIKFPPTRRRQVDERPATWSPLPKKAGYEASLPFVPIACSPPSLSVPGKGARAEEGCGETRVCGCLKAVKKL